MHHMALQETFRTTGTEKAKVQYNSRTLFSQGSNPIYWYHSEGVGQNGTLQTSTTESFLEFYGLTGFGENIVKF